MLLFPRKSPPVPAAEKLRTRVGIKGIFDRNLAKGEQVTLEQAIAILRAGW